MRLALVVIVVLIGCGGSDSVGAGPDGGVIQRGMRGTGSIDAGGVWALCAPCSATDVSQCPFRDAGGTCYGANNGGSVFCGLPGPCPTGSDVGTLVNVPLCVKECPGGAADCPSFTNCYKGLCVPY